MRIGRSVGMSASHGLLLTLLGAALIIGMTATDASGQSKITYAEYDRLLRAYVNARGLVNYAGLKRELPALKSFVDQLAAVSPDTHPQLFPNDGERRRYYLTAYNAWVLYFAAAAYPSKSELWNFLGLFRDHDITLGGRKSSLETLEHQILRKRFQDPRIHFYINCAALSCPPLQPGAIPEGGTEEALEQAARRFINDTSQVRYDAAGKKLQLSRIFKWFADDFLNHLRDKRGHQKPHIAQYILLYLDGPARAALAQTPLTEVRVSYFGYDKSLNEQK
jgi:hypothetical protein